MFQEGKKENHLPLQIKALGKWGNVMLKEPSF